MGGCCTREQEFRNDKLSSIHYSTEEIINVDIRNISKPELRLESFKIVKSKEETQLGYILDSLVKIFKNKTKIITPIELFNLAIFYKENNINNDYLIYDMRRSCEQKEDYLKKMKHVNYSYEQIKNIKKTTKFEKLQTFLDNKTIIFIISEFFLNLDNNKEGCKKVEEYPFEIIKLLFGINNNINFLLLNSSLNNKEMPVVFKKYEDFLADIKSYNDIPYILFSYKHVTTFYIEGYFFIDFLEKSKLSFENYVKNYNNRNVLENNENIDIKNSAELNTFSFNHNFIKQMKIYTIITIDNKSEKNYEIKDYQFRTSVFKEYTLSKKDIIAKKEEIKNLCERLKKDINKGHSCYFNVENFDNIEGIGSYDWLLVIIVLLSMITEISYINVINYLRHKINYVNNIQQLFEDCVNNELVEDYILNI